MSQYFEELANSVELKPLIDKYYNNGQELADYLNALTEPQILQPQVAIKIKTLRAKTSRSGNTLQKALHKKGLNNVQAFEFFEYLKLSRVVVVLQK